MGVEDAIGARIGTRIGQGKSAASTCAGASAVNRLDSGTASSPRSWESRMLPSCQPHLRPASTCAGASAVNRLDSGTASSPSLLEGLMARSRAARCGGAPELVRDYLRCKCGEPTRLWDGVVALALGRSGGKEPCCEMRGLEAPELVRDYLRWRKCAWTPQRASRRGSVPDPLKEQARLALAQVGLRSKGAAERAERAQRDASETARRPEPGGRSTPQPLRVILQAVPKQEPSLLYAEKRGEEPRSCSPRDREVKELS